MSEHAREGLMVGSSDRVGVDAVSVKPSEIALDRPLRLPVDRVVVDWEGHDHLPDPDILRRLAGRAHVRVTVPVRADGFDPLGDDSQFTTIPDGIAFAFVAGHPAYLSPEERRRSVAPRFGAALDRYPDAWVGTEGVTEVALATGATQFDLLAAGTERRLRALRSAGFAGDIAIYAPTV
ncbi:MAG: luciferase, partial [Halobacteriales archaeon]|nr:luciferase [Halobacteriales archaeon]